MEGGDYGRLQKWPLERCPPPLVGPFLYFFDFLSKNDKVFFMNKTIGVYDPERGGYEIQDYKPAYPRIDPFLRLLTRERVFVDEFKAVGNYPPPGYERVLKNLAPLFDDVPYYFVEYDRRELSWPELTADEQRAVVRKAGKTLARMAGGVAALGFLVGTYGDPGKSMTPAEQDAIAVSVGKSYYEDKATPLKRYEALYVDDAPPYSFTPKRTGAKGWVGAVLNGMREPVQYRFGDPCLAGGPYDTKSKGATWQITGPNLEVFPGGSSGPSLKFNEKDGMLHPDDQTSANLAGKCVLGGLSVWRVDKGVNRTLFIKAGTYTGRP